MYVVELACFRVYPQHVPTLVERAGPLLHALRRRFPGLQKLLVTRMGDGRWLQLGFWDSRENAEAAAAAVFEAPELGDWLAQVGEFAEFAAQNNCR